MLWAKIIVHTNDISSQVFTTEIWGYDTLVEFQEMLPDISTTRGPGVGI